MSIISPLPFTLVNGTVADATQVMADFNAIVSEVNSGAAPLSSVLFITPEQFGAAGNGVSDDTAAIQEAINAAAPDGIVFFSAKTYLITAGLTCANPITLQGVGAGVGPGPGFLAGGSVIKAGPLFTTGDMFFAQTYQGVTVRGIRWDSANQRTSGCAIHIESPSPGVNVNYNSLIEDCGFNQQYDCIALTECEVPTIQRNLFELWSNYGVHLDISSGVEGSFGFIGHNNFFNVHANGTLNNGFAAIGGNGGYGFIHHNVFIGSQYGINMTLQGAGAVTTATLLISGNQFEEQITEAIALARSLAGIIFSNVVIQGNEFANINASTVATLGAHILIANDGVGDWIAQLIIANNVMSSALTNAGAHFIDIQTGTNIIVQANTLNNQSASASVVAIRTNGLSVAPSQVLDNIAAGFSPGKVYDCNSGTVVRDQANQIRVTDLGSWANGSQVYVTDGGANTATDPTLVGGKGGCMATRMRNTWYAPYAFT